MQNETEYLKKGFFGRKAYRIRGFMSAAYGDFLHPKTEFSAASSVHKGAIILSYIIPGSGHIVQKRIEKGLIGLALTALYIWYLSVAGVGAFIGTGIFSELKGIGIFVTILFTALFCYFYPKSVTSTINYSRHLSNGGKREKNITVNIFKAFASGLSTFTDNLKEAFKHSNLRQAFAIVTAFTLPGISGLFLMQFIKGILKFILSAAIIFYMVLRGFADLIGLFTLRTEGVKSNYNIVFGLIALFITIFFLAFYILNIASTVKLTLKQQKGEKLPAFIEDFSQLLNKKLYVLFLSIPVTGVLTFTILPLIYMISVAFTNFATSSSLGVIPNPSADIYLKWVGLDTFKKLFVLSDYFKAFTGVLSWTLIWAFLATFSCYFGGLLLAMLINKKVVKFKVLFRSLFVLSMAVPQLVTLRVMYAMFHAHGPINSALLNMGLLSERFVFWENVTAAKILIIFVNMWVGIPYFMLLMSGLLINIPKDLYEYAKVEGAGKFYVFRKITMPFLLFMTTPLLITNFVSNINNFNVIWLLTGGGPSGLGNGGVAGGTDILITWLYKLTMQNVPNYNIGSAIGIIMFIISASLSLIIYRNSSSYKREGDFN